MNLPHLSDLPRWRGARRVAIDIETRDPDLKTLGPGVRRGGYITGVSFAIDRDGTGSPMCPAYYLPVRHQGGGNYPDPDQVFAYLREQGEEFRGEVVGANLQYDLDYLLEEGVAFRPSYFRDVLVSGALLVEPKLSWQKKDGRVYLAEDFEAMRMNLDAVAKRAGIPGKVEGTLAQWAERNGLDPKKDMWRAPAHIIAEYAKGDVRVPLQVMDRHLRQIDEDDMWTVYNLECELLPVLLEMRRVGVAVDLDKVDQIRGVAKQHELEAAKVIGQRSGMSFDADDINKSAVLAKHLKADGIKVPKTPTGLDSVKAEWLDTLDTPVAQAIKECRKWNKVRTTFCESIQRHAVRGRVHCTFNQLRMERETGNQKGVGFGRLSSDAPNLQQQPARDPEIGPLWRSIYLPDDGGTWACLDFSSQEPRWITHYAEAVANENPRSSKWWEETRKAAWRAAEACRTDPDWDNHSMMAEMIYPDEFSKARYLDGSKADKLLRGNAKTIFLGLCYGMGGGKLCRSLGLPSERVVTSWSDGKKVEVAGPEGQALLDRFDRGVPYVRALARLCRDVANERGYVTTKLGRRCRFPRHPDTHRVEWAHKALNRLIQGSSADQTKLAMVQAHREGIRLQLQVHDELDLTIWDRKEAEQLSEIMQTAVEGSVPFRVDIETGPNWGEIK